MGLLRQKTIREVILILLLHGNCTHEQIATVVKLSPSTVSWHLNKLQEGGVIGSGKDGRRTIYWLLADKDQIISLLVAYQESFLDSLVDRVIEMWE
jgi:predicted transcriptional regulator